METNSFSEAEQEIIQTIIENAQYGVKTKISASLRYTGGTEIEKTERTPQAYEMFSLLYSETIKEKLGDDISDERIKVIIDHAFETIIAECTEDFFVYRKKSFDIVKILYGLAFIVLLIAFVLQMLGWTVK